MKYSLLLQTLIEKKRFDDAAYLFTIDNTKFTYL